MLSGFPLYNYDICFKCDQWYDSSSNTNNNELIADRIILP